MGGSKGGKIGQMKNATCNHRDDRNLTKEQKWEAIKWSPSLGTFATLEICYRQGRIETT